MITREDLDQAQALVRGHFQPTPHYRWPLIEARTGTETWVKHENHAPTGAFKVRGGLVHFERLAREGLAPNGVISATRGNHGQSLGYAGQRFGIGVTIVVPEGNSVEKNEAMRALGVRLIEHGADFDTARQEAMRLAESEGLVFVPSFHRDLVAGVATWAFELLSAQPDLDLLYVPIGLGSSICGAIAVRDLLGLETKIVGVQSSAAPAYARSLDQGKPVALDTAATNADGLAVRIPDPAAFELIRAGVSRIVTVDDDEIAAAIRAYWTDTHNLAEGAGAAPLAAAIKDGAAIAGHKVALVLSGGNIDLALFRRWVLGEG